MAYLMILDGGKELGKVIPLNGVEWLFDMKSNIVGYKAGTDVWYSLFGVKFSSPEALLQTQTSNHVISDDGKEIGRFFTDGEMRCLYNMTSDMVGYETDGKYFSTITAKFYQSAEELLSDVENSRLSNSQADTNR